VTKRPLEGKVVLVTRPPDQSKRLVQMLEERGAEAIAAPAIEVRPAPPGALDRAAADLARGEYAWLVVTSRAGVEAVFNRLGAGKDRRRTVPALVAAVGEGTAGALREHGIEPDLVPATFTTTALGKAMPRGNGKVLLARADIAPPGLDDAVRKKGWTPVRVDAYRTQLAGRLPSAAADALRLGRVDVVTFTSASTVEGFVGAARQLMDEGVALPAAVCIGPVTAAAAREAGISVVAEGRPHTIEGLMAALERAMGSPGRKES
jgi:uroporphyrinogen-III synthase